MEKLCKIRDLQRAIYLFELDFEKEHGIGLNEGMALCSLYKNEKLSSGELVEMLGLTASNTSKVIRSIEDKGFIERQLGSEDKRQMYFTLNKKGKDLIESIKCREMILPQLLSDIIE